MKLSEINVKDILDNLVIRISPVNTMARKDIATVEIHNNLEDFDDDRERNKMTIKGEFFSRKTKRLIVLGLINDFKNCSGFKTAKEFVASALSENETISGKYFIETKTNEKAFKKMVGEVEFDAIMKWKGIEEWAQAE